MLNFSYWPILLKKLGQVSQRRTNGSRELDSMDISARNRISCNLRESKFALAARAIRAVEFFNRIGRLRPVAASRTDRNTTARKRYFVLVLLGDNGSSTIR